MSVISDKDFSERFGEDKPFNLFFIPGYDIMLAQGFEWRIPQPISARLWNGQCTITHEEDGSYKIRKESGLSTEIVPLGRHI